MNNFLLDYLPSFYSDYLVDENGDNLLEPLFDNQIALMGDAIFQAQQIARMPYLEKAPSLFIETYVSIDISESNIYLDGYKIDSNIIGYSDIYLDSKYSIMALQVGDYDIKHDVMTGQRYIVPNGWSTAARPDVIVLFAKYCYRDYKTLQNTFGFLTDYKINIPDFNTSVSSQYDIVYNDINAAYVNYKNQLLGLCYTIFHGSTFNSLNKGLSIFLGLKYAEFDAIVLENSSNTLILQDLSTSDKTTITSTNLRSDLTVGTKVFKYDILEAQTFEIFDIFSEPAKFTQLVLCNEAELLLSLLNINTSDNEKYASIKYDSVIHYDDVNLYMDMGNNTGSDNTFPVDATDYASPFDSLVTNFSDWNDSRFLNEKIYEMFRGLLFVTHTNLEDADKIKLFFEKNKQSINYILFAE